MIAPLSLPPEAAFPIVVIAKATLLLGAALLATSLLSQRRAPAAARHLVWTLAVCGLLALPLFSAALPAWRLGIVTLDTPGADAVSLTPPAFIPAPADIPGRAASADLAPTPPPAPVPLPPADPVLAGSGDRGMNLALLIPAIYLLVVLALLGRILVGRLSVRRLSREAVAVTDPEWTGLVRDLAWMLDIQRPVTLLRGGSATMPMTWGVRRPTILLPAEAHAWPTERLRVVLLHELAHVARYDCLTQTLAAVACAVYWFHPGAWHAARRLRVERELACDDRVLAAGTRAREYAAHLLEVARAFRAPALAGAAAVSMARPSQLEGRLLAVLDGVRDRRQLTPRAAALSAAAAVALVLALGAVRPGEARAAQRQTPGRLPSAAATPRASAPAQQRRSGPGCEMRQGTTFNCQVDARPGERLTLELPQFVSARIVGRDRQGVSVRTPSGRTLSVRAERVADGVRVVVIHPPRGRDRGGPELVIEVPSRFDVQAAADGGGVEIRDLRGTFTGHTRGGGLALIRAAGTVRMDAGGGGAMIQDTRLDGRIEMRGGGVLLGPNEGNLQVVGAGGTVFSSAGAASGWRDRVHGQTDRWTQQERAERARDAAEDAGDEDAVERAAEMARDAARDAARAGARAGVGVTTLVDGGEVDCRGSDCTVRVDGRNVVTTRPDRGRGQTVTIADDEGGYTYSSGDPDGRIESIRSMARYAPADAAALGIARMALGDPDPRVQRAAVDALRSLRGAARDQQLRRIAREHRSADIRQRAAAALR